MTTTTDPGLERPTTEPLTGTVKLYQRHIFICTGQTGWPARLEQGGGFAQAWLEAVAAAKPRLAGGVKVTACDAPSPGPGHDLLVFPDMIRYRAVQGQDFPALVDDHLVGNRVSDRVRHERLSGHYVFVCTHHNRDERCGVSGPPLVRLFEAELRQRGLAGPVTVHQTSHVGGHRFAGNVLFYPSGDWYGYVTPADIPRLIEGQLLRQEIVRELWRGRMGLDQARQLQMGGEPGHG